MCGFGFTSKIFVKKSSKRDSSSVTKIQVIRESLELNSNENEKRNKRIRKFSNNYHQLQTQHLISSKLQEYSFLMAWNEDNLITYLAMIRERL